MQRPVTRAFSALPVKTQGGGEPYGNMAGCGRLHWIAIWNLQVKGVSPTHFLCVGISLGVGRNLATCGFYELDTSQRRSSALGAGRGRAVINQLGEQLAHPPIDVVTDGADRG